MRDLFIYQEGNHYIVEAETKTAVSYLNKLCGYKWRMLDHTNEEEVLVTSDKGTISQLIQALSKTTFKFDNFVAQYIEPNKPQEGKLYALTGGPGANCISNGNSWSDSEVPQ